MVFVIAMVSCKKDTLEIPEGNDPVFNVSGTFGGESIGLVAGDNNAYMHTMTAEEFGVQVYSGELSDEQTSVEIGIYSGNVDNGNVEFLGQLPEYLALSSANEGELLRLSKAVLSTQLNSQEIDKINWYVDDVFVGVDEVEIHQPGKFNVCAEIKFLSGDTATLCNEVIVGYQINGDCWIDFNVNNYTISAYPRASESGPPVSGVQWTLDGSLDLGSSIDSLNYQLSDSLVHTLTAQIELSNGVKRTRSVLASKSSTALSCNDFSIFERQVTNTYIQDFKVRVKVKKNGKSYCSECADNADSYFQLTGYDYYGVNAEGKDVYKVSGAIVANLWEEGTVETILPLNLEMQFGIEIP